jgi:hypothetical protein
MCDLDPKQGWALFLIGCSYIHEGWCRSLGWKPSFYTVKTICFLLLFWGIQGQDGASKPLNKCVVDPNQGWFFFLTGCSYIPEGWCRSIGLKPSFYTVKTIFLCFCHFFWGIQGQGGAKKHRKCVL